MNRLENNAANSILEYIKTDPILEALAPVEWDTENEAQILPRISIKVTQGEEVVYLMAVYALNVQLTVRYRAADNVSGDIGQKLQTLLQDAGPLDTDLTDAHFHCFGRSSGVATQASNSGDGRRTVTSTFTLVGFDLDRTFAEPEEP